MKPKHLFVLLAFFMFSFCAYAQDVTVRGVIKDQANNILANADITIEMAAEQRSIDIRSNAKGEFGFILHKNITPSKVKAEYNGMRLQRWDYSASQKLLEIFMTSAPITLRGKVVDSQSQPQPALKITIDGIAKPSFIMTDEEGKFMLELPADKTVGGLGFIINSQLVPREHILYNEDKAFITITAGKELNTNNQMVTIVVEDEIGNPMIDVAVLINDKTYHTNSKGEFKLVRSLLQPTPNKAFPETTKTVVQGYDLLKRNFDENDIYLIVKTGKQITEDSIMQEDLTLVINELELEKQILSQKSTQIQAEIEKVTDKLAHQETFSDQQRKTLFDYLENLKTTLVSNELAYQAAQEKTKDVIDKMRKVLIDKDSQFQESQTMVRKKDEQIEQEEKIIGLVSFLAIVMLITAVGFFIFARRIVKQKDKISRQRDEIETQKNEITTAYQNIQTISNIGQEITALLDINMLVQVLHKHVSSLMDATVFGVGIPNESNQRMEFKNFIDNNTVMAYHAENLEDDNKFSVWCYKKEKPVIINDLSVEHKKYVKVMNIDFTDENLPKSLIYLPLHYEGDNLGVLTVQSRKTNAYDEVEINILQALASYVAVALANAKSYKIVKDTYDILEVKNRNITDSIRYAQTIQQTILPSTKELQNALQSYFIVYKPKDIVSGDFYWLASQMGEDIYEKNKTFLAAVDCTGHGVPGAFMSMVGSNILNEIVKIRREYNPAKILELLDIAVVGSLKQYDKSNNDGMDVCLCLLETQDTQIKVTFAGTRRPLYYIPDDGKLVEVRGDRSSIGGVHRNENKAKNFTNNEILLQAGNMIFLTTDGVADQNNLQKEKYSTQRLKNILETNAVFDVDTQKRMLEDEINSYMKGVEQRDDITIVGVRL
jgi:serine phosphatase RsbU (regulator of sigma subunit)